MICCNLEEVFELISPSTKALPNYFMTKFYCKELKVSIVYISQGEIGRRTLTTQLF